MASSRSAEIAEGMNNITSMDSDDMTNLLSMIEDYMLPRTDEDHYDSDFNDEDLDWDDSMDAAPDTGLATLENGEENGDTGV